MSNLENNTLIQDLSALIEESKQHVARVANSALTLLFWHVGKRINEEILNNERAEYGKQIVGTVSRQFHLIFSVVTIKLQNTDIKLVEASPIVPPLATQFKRTKNGYEKL